MVVFTLNFLHSRVDAKLKEVGVGGTQAHQLELQESANDIELYSVACCGKRIKTVSSTVRDVTPSTLSWRSRLA